MNRYALIQNGKIANVVEQDSTPTIEGQWIEVVGAYGPGDIYSNGVFSKAPTPAAIRHITPLAFLTRFTDAEAITIDLASIGATVEAASMRRYLAKVNAAKHVDLDRADTRAGVQALQTATILAVGRAAIILDAAIQDFERP